MDYQSLHMKTVADLRKLAKTMGVRLPADTARGDLIAERAEDAAVAGIIALGIAERAVLVGVEGHGPGVRAQAAGATASRVLL